jgi:hypothetical protein
LTLFGSIEDANAGPPPAPVKRSVAAHAQPQAVTGSRDRRNPRVRARAKGPGGRTRRWRCRRERAGATFLNHRDGAAIDKSSPAGSSRDPQVADAPTRGRSGTCTCRSGSCNDGRVGSPECTQSGESLCIRSCSGRNDDVPVQQIPRRPRAWQLLTQVRSQLPQHATVLGRPTAEEQRRSSSVSRLFPPFDRASPPWLRPLPGET